MIIKMHWRCLFAFSSCLYFEGVGISVFLCFVFSVSQALSFFFNLHYLDRSFVVMVHVHVSLLYRYSKIFVIGNTWMEFDSNDPSVNIQERKLGATTSVTLDDRSNNPQLKVLKTSQLKSNMTSILFPFMALSL